MSLDRRYGALVERYEELGDVECNRVRDLCVDYWEARARELEVPQARADATRPSHLRGAPDLTATLLLGEMSAASGWLS